MFFCVSKVEILPLIVKVSLIVFMMSYAGGGWQVRQAGEEKKRFAEYLILTRNRAETRRLNVTNEMAINV